MSKGYQKQGPGKPQGFPGPSSDPRKFSTGARWSLWNGRCETAGALGAPAGLPPAAPILPGQARYPRGVCPPIQHTSGGSTNGGIGCRPPPAPDTGAMPKARVSRIGGPGWVWPGGPRRSRSHTGHTPPAALCLLCRQGQSRPPRRAESPRQIL